MIESNVADLDELRYARAMHEMQRQRALRIVHAYERVHGRLPPPPDTGQAAKQVAEWASSAEGQAALKGEFPPDEFKDARGRALLDAFERAHGHEWNGKNITELRRFATEWVNSPEGKCKLDVCEAKFSS